MWDVFATMLVPYLSSSAGLNILTAKSRLGGEKKYKGYGSRSNMVTGDSASLLGWCTAMQENGLNIFFTNLRFRSPTDYIRVL